MGEACGTRCLPWQAVGLAATHPALGVELLEELLHRDDARQAIRVLPRLRLFRAHLLPPTLGRLRLGALKPRARWLARAHHWDLIDSFFAQAAAGIAAAVEVAVGAGTAGLAACSSEGGEDGVDDGALDTPLAVDRAVLRAQLDRSQWASLAGLLSAELVGQGLRAVAVQVHPTCTNA